VETGGELEVAKGEEKHDGGDNSISSL
jgi:hypothetical protein